MARLCWAMCSLLLLDIVLSFQEVEASTSYVQLSLLQTNSQARGARTAVSTEASATAQQVNRWMSMGELARVVRAGKLNVSGTGMLKLTSSAGVRPPSRFGHEAGFVNFVTDMGIVGQQNARQMTLKQDLLLGEAPRPEPSKSRKPPFRPEPQMDDPSQPSLGLESEGALAPSFVLAPSSPSVVLPILEEHLATLVADAGDLRDVFSAMRDAATQDRTGTLSPVGFIQTPQTGSIVSEILHRLGLRRKLSLYDGQSHGSIGGGMSHVFDMVCTDAVFDHAWMSVQLKPQPLLFTVLRSPLEQVKSEFEHCGSRCGKDWPGRMDWLQRASPSEASRFVNPQARQLGWDVSMDNLDNREWFGRLSEELGIVLLTDHLNEGLVLLGRKLGLSPQDLEYVSVSEDRQLPPSKQAAELQRFLAIDEALYAHFNKTFWSAWEAAGGYDLMGADVEELQLRSQTLERACKADNPKVCTSEFRIGRVILDSP